MSRNIVLRRINWRIFAILLGAGLLGVLAVLPFMLDLLSSRALGQAPAPEVSLPIVVALSLLQNGVLLAVLIFIGLFLSERIGLQMPVIAAWANGERPSNLRTIVLPGMLVGAVVAVLMIGVDALFFVRRLPAALHPLFEIPLWKRLLAGVLYGGITEELLTRLFLMSLAAWLLGRLFKTPAGLPSPVAFWAAIVLVALLFGLGHLPITSVMTPLTPMIVTRALVLNGVAGIAFGFLYWRHGLEAAMLGHMSAHIVIQVPGVMLIKSML